MDCTQTEDVLKLGYTLDSMFWYAYAKNSLPRDALRT